MKLTPGWALIQANFDPIQEKGQSRGWALFRGWVLFCETTVYVAYKYVEWYTSTILIDLEVIIICFLLYYESTYVAQIS